MVEPFGEGGGSGLVNLANPLVYGGELWHVDKNTEVRTLPWRRSRSTYQLTGYAYIGTVKSHA